MEKRACEILTAVSAGADIRTMALRVAEYARVSTDSDPQRKSLENQMDTYRQMIRETPGWTYAGTYADAAVTGTKAALRGGFQQMIGDAAAGKFDLILVKDVARFARNIKECLVYKDRLKSWGVMVYFVKENLNTFRAGDELMLQFMALGAEMEAKSARARTKIVFEQGIRRGRVYGNGRILGYTKDRCALKADPMEAAAVRRIFALYVEQRMGLRRIARTLAGEGLARRDGAPISVHTVRSVLENPKYKGYYCGGKSEKLDLGERYVRRPRPAGDWVLYRDPAIPALVSESVWDQAADIRAARRRQFHRETATPCSRGRYRYSGLVESGAAPGRHYTRAVYRYGGAARELWQCRGVPGRAGGPAVYTDELDAVVCQLLAGLPGGGAAVVDRLMACYRALGPVQPDAGRRTALEKELAALAVRRARLLGLYEDALVTREEYAARTAAHRRRQAQLEAQLAALPPAGEKPAAPAAPAKAGGEPPAALPALCRFCGPTGAAAAGSAPLGQPGGAKTHLAGGPPDIGPARAAPASDAAGPAASPPDPAAALAARAAGLLAGMPPGRALIEQLVAKITVRPESTRRRLLLEVTLRPLAARPVFAVHRARCGPTGVLCICCDTHS